MIGRSCGDHRRPQRPGATPPVVRQSPTMDPRLSPGRTSMASTPGEHKHGCGGGAMRASWPQRGAAAHGRSTRTASSNWRYCAGPDGTSEGAHRGARLRGTAHQLRRQGGALAELAPKLASVPTVNASPQRWRYGFANEWRSCGIGIRPAWSGPRPLSAARAVRTLR
jgi:hypothetical protein